MAAAKAEREPPMTFLAENQVREDDDYFIVSSIFHKDNTKNWTIGIALCRKGGMSVVDFSRRLAVHAPQRWPRDRPTSMKDFFELHSWFTFVRYSPLLGCVGVIYGTIDPTDEDPERPPGWDMTIIAPLTMSVDWVESFVPRQKIGTHLMLQMAAEAIARDAYIMELDDTSDWPDFYTKLAFKSVDPAEGDMCAFTADVLKAGRERLSHNKGVDKPDWRKRRRVNGRLVRGFRGKQGYMTINAGPGLRF